MKILSQAEKFQNVNYEIRGKIYQTALKLEQQGEKILKLNIGNPAPFGFEAPKGIIEDIKENLTTAHGYCDSQGLLSAREAIVEYYQDKNFTNIDVNDVYIGNGVSELITMSMLALLNKGDEVLIPIPDYPLWTAAVNLAGGKAVHYLCNEENDWNPDIEDIKSKITPQTKAILIINPNNPTGAVYSKEVLLEIVKIAKTHNLIILADEVYEKIVYDNAIHHHIATLAPDLFCITYNGLSKTYLVAGFRQGWMILSGDKSKAKGFINGLQKLSSMRLCAVTPMQYAIKNAILGEQTITQHITKNGRLLEQRNTCFELLCEIPYISCVKPKGALYMFPKIDTEFYGIKNDSQFILDLLIQQKVLLVQGSGFNWHKPDHFRIVTLADCSILIEAINRLKIFLQNYKQ